MPPPQEAPGTVSYLDNGQIRVGVNTELGGAITYLSRSGNDPDRSANLINSFDWGRQVQMSHYSGPIPFAPRGKQPRKDWAGLGWNPIQSGDCYGNRSRLLEHKNDGRTITVRCIPMQWPLENEPGECIFECHITLEGNAVRVRSRLFNARSDKTQYPGRDQELPAVYTNGPWYRLLTYTGDRPFTGDKTLTTIPAKMPWTGWQATENWAALLNDSGWGLGIHAPGVFSFLGGFAGKPGTGSAKDGPTGYIAPLHREIIDHNIEYAYEYTLIVGTLEEIRRQVYDRTAKSARTRPPLWRFTKDRQHWIYANATDTGWPLRGELNIPLEANDPYLLSPAGFWYARDAPILSLEAAFQTGEKQAVVFWQRSDSPAFREALSLAFPVIPDGKYRRYTIDLSASPEYRGTITALRLDPVNTGRPGDSLRLRSLGFLPGRA